MGLTDIIRVVADALVGEKRQIVEQEQEGGLFAGLANALGAPDQAIDPRIRPASEDPLGDPADLMFGQDVLPASQDPLGDPGDPLYGQNIRPARMDPLGDPADQERR